MTGVTTSTCSSDDTMPPSTGVASGFITSEPTRVLHMIGSSPATTVLTVITFGRRRNRAPSTTASPTSLAPKVVMRSVSGISQTSNQPEPSRSRCASATVRLQPLTPMYPLAKM